MRLIDRFVFSQIIPVFLFGILAFTGLFLGAGALSQIIRFAIDYNANMGLVLLAFMYKLPEIITFTLPMSTLFSIIFTFNRMSSDLEITALRASGVSFLRLVTPALLFAYAVSICALVINDKGVPAANSRFNDMMAQLKKSDTIGKSDFTLMDKQGNEQRLIYIKDVKGRQITGITLQEFESDRPVRYITARKGIITDHNTLMLSGIESVIFYPNSKNRAGNATRNTFVQTPDMVEIPFQHNADSMAREQKKDNELPIRELRKRLEMMRQEGAEPLFMRKTKFIIHNKLAIPFASLAFALIAAPLALRPARASSSIGIGISAVIILLYYIMSEIFRVLGQGYINPVLAAWLPDIILFSLGIVLCVKAKR